MRNIWRRLFGSRCDAHDVPYRSDFCPLCVRTLDYRQATQDKRRLAKANWRKPAQESE